MIRTLKKFWYGPTALEIVEDRLVELLGRHLPDSRKTARTILKSRVDEWAWGSV